MTSETKKEKLKTKICSIETKIVQVKVKQTKPFLVKINQ
jgi:hypothetical protein